MRKKGELYIISIFLFAIICLLILFSVIVSYFQINTVLLGVKDSMFSISQNAIIAYNMENLAYDVYDIDIEKLRTIINEMLLKNHIEGKSKIENIEIKELYLISNKNECIYHTNGKFEDAILHVILKVNFIPVINIGTINEFTIHEDVKLSLMKY